MIRPHRCPICEKQFSPTDTSATSNFPFCSDRCRQVDLLRWMDGRYALVEQLDPEVAEFLQAETDIPIDDGT